MFLGRGVLDSLLLCLCLVQQSNYISSRIFTFNDMMNFNLIAGVLILSSEHYRTLSNSFYPKTLNVKKIER